MAAWTTAAAASDQGTSVTQRYTEATIEELWDRIERAHQQLAALSRSLPKDSPVRGSDWTNRDLVAHLVTVMRRYTERDTTTREGLAATPRELDAINADQLETLAGRALPDLIDDLERGVVAVRQAFGPEAAPDLDERFEFHGEIRVDGAAALANLIGELRIHGYDLAQPAGRHWDFPDRDAELVIGLITQVFTAYVLRAQSGSLSIELRVPGATRWNLGMVRGQGESRPSRSGDRPDVVVRAGARVLALGLYDRLSVPQMARRGALVVGGRRPWKILALRRYVERP